MRPQITIAPVVAPSDACPHPAPALFVGGVMLRGLKMFVADDGGDVLLVLDAANITVDPRVRRVPLPATRFSDRPDLALVPADTRLATDGQA